MLLSSALPQYIQDQISLRISNNKSIEVLNAKQHC